jgi:hypothetical protein
VGVVVAVGGLAGLLAGVVVAAAGRAVVGRTDAVEAVLGALEPEPPPLEEVSPLVSSSLARLASADCSAALACSSVTSAL